jgi:hypothetical protein
MDWQQPAALAVVAFTGYFFVRHEIRSRRKSHSRACGSDCGCGAGDEERPAAENSATHREEEERNIRPEQGTASLPSAGREAESY